MKPKQIRPIAICVFLNGDRIFVAEGYDPNKKETFYRPLGGEISFGELSRDCIIREIKEEMGEEIKDLKYLDLMENRFVYDGKSSHEIVLVYEALFVDPHLYQVESVKCQEDDGLEFTAWWKPISEFREGRIPLYPEGMLDLLDQWRKKRSS